MLEQDKRSKTHCKICNKILLNNEPYEICIDCFKDLPGYVDYQSFSSPYRNNFLKYCDKHGYWIGHNQYAICPKCIKEIKTVDCAICGSPFVIENNHLGRIQNKETINICNTCSDKLPGTGNHICFCNNCKQYVKKEHNFSKCPVCNGITLKPYVVPCQICGKDIYTHAAPGTYFYQHAICENCKEELGKSSSVKLYEKLLKDPNTIIRNNILMVPINFKSQTKYPFKFTARTCESCGRTYIPSSPNQRTCGSCYQILFCDGCKHHYVVPPLLSPKNGHSAKSPLWKACSKSCSTKIGIKNKKFCNINDFNKINSSKLEEDQISEILNEISKEIVEKWVEINNDNITDFDYKGIWVKTDANRVVLDVMWTTNIKKEYNWIQQALKYNTSFKYQELRKYPIIKYYYISSWDTEEEGLMIELYIAKKYNAKYWNAAPGFQTKMLKSISKEEMI